MLSPPFPSPFEFRCGEPVGEGERGRPFPLPFLLGCFSKLALRDPKDAESPLSELCLALSLPCFSISLRSELLLLVCPRLDISLGKMRIFFFSRCLWTHQPESAIIILLVAKCRLLSVNVPKVFQFYRLFNLHLAQTLQCAVSRSVSDC